MNININWSITDQLIILLITNYELNKISATSIGVKLNGALFLQIMEYDLLGYSTWWITRWFVSVNPVKNSVYRVLIFHYVKRLNNHVTSLSDSPCWLPVPSCWGTEHIWFWFLKLMHIDIFCGQFLNNSEIYQLSGNYAKWLKTPLSCERKTLKFYFIASSF